MLRSSAMTSVGTSVRIATIAVGQRVEQYPAIFHGPAHGTGVIEAGRQRNDPAPIDGAICRLEPRDAAERGGAAHRAAGIRTDAAKDHARGDRSGGAARRSAREPRHLPGIVGRRPRHIPGRGRKGELMAGELAKHDNAAFGEPFGHSRISIGNVVDELVGIRRGRNALRLEYVLEPNRDAVQRSAPIRRRQWHVPLRALPLGPALPSR